ncbi:hypothetical protein PIB30_068859 [Stylosanthes scabra]|uniref:Uncharacterized protein n=1 Tax=Stylosanthes scabra TaxID=79078 RepID=A0ABU6URN7_9FABA|nr:hypothetical protein [Stylosanthes scabra]
MTEGNTKLPKEVLTNRHHDATTFGASLTTREARNVGNIGLPEFGATVPDIGLERPKSLKNTYLESSIRQPRTNIMRAPKSLFGEALLAHTHLSHKPPTFHFGTSGYAGSPKPLEAKPFCTTLYTLNAIPLYPAMLLCLCSDQLAPSKKRTSYNLRV